MKRFMFLLATAVLLSSCRLGQPDPTFSDGYRVGRIEKISHKGIVYKTWEGYLVLDGYSKDENGALQRVTFEFSVLPADEAKVIPVLTHAQEYGGRVRLHYHQDLLPQVRYDSNYFIVDAVELGN